MRNNIQTIPGRFGSKPSLFRIVRNSDDNEISESYHGLREEKDGDGDGLVNDGKPSERPVDPNRDGGKKSFKTADDLRKAGFNVIGADRLNEIDPVAMTGLHDGLQELKQNFPGIEKAISGVKAEKLPADVPFTVRKSGASITVLIDPDQMKSAKFAKFSKQIEKSQKSGFLASREGFLGVMHHELGHVVDLAPFEMQYSWGVSAAKTFVKQNPPSSQQLQSRYAFQDKAKQNQEVWAEAYASWKTNKEPTEWQKKFNAIMDGRGKKESVDNPLVGDDKNLTEAFCKTGKGGGVDNSCSSRRKKNASQQNTPAPRVSSPAAAEKKSKKKKGENQDDIVKRFDIDPGVLFEMSKEDLDAHERALRFNRIRMSQDDYAQLLGKTMIIKATHWKRSDEYQEFQRKLKFIQDGGVDPVTGFEGEQEVARLTKEMEKAKAKFQVWLTGSPDEQKALVQGLRNEHAKGVRNAIKDNREVPDVALHPYLTEKWMPESIRSRFGQGLDSKIESWKSDAVKQSITKYMLGGMIESEKERIVKRDSKFSAMRANMLRDLDDIETRREQLDKERLDISFQRINLENQIADAQKAINSKSFKTPDEEQELNRKIDSSKKERDRLLKEYEQNLKAAEEFGYRDRVSEVVKKHLGVENGIKITASLKFDKSISQSAAAKITEKYVAAKKFLESVISDRKSISNPNVKIEVRPDIDRAYYDNQGTVFISPTSSVATIAHEIGHHLEQMSSWPGTMTPTAVRSKALVAAEAGDRLEVHPTFATWSQVKTAIEKDPKNTPKEWYGLEVYAGQKDGHNENNTHRNYARKLYPQEGASEVITMGITRLIESPAFFLVNDSTHFDFVAQWMKGEAD